MQRAHDDDRRTRGPGSGDRAPPETPAKLYSIHKDLRSRPFLQRGAQVYTQEDWRKQRVRVNTVKSLGAG